MPSPIAARQTSPRQLASHLFGIDVRSLALFRIGLGALLLADLAWRLPDLEAHYTDFGILPRVAMIERFGDMLGRPSLHLMSGSVWGQGALFAVAAFFAVLLMVGYRTRAVAFISWILLISLNNRNPLVVQGGDTVLRLLLFWSLFLPLGACWSVDRAMAAEASEPVPTRFRSVGTAALLLQVCFIYWFGALLKTDASWRTEGTAVYYALSIPQFAKPLGSFLLQFPALLKMLTFATMALEAFGPFLAFSPIRNGPLRTLTVFLFIGFHIGLGMCLTLGLFPAICTVAWLAFLPTWFWEKVRSRLVSPAARGFRIYYDADCNFCRKMVALIRTFFCLPPTAAAPAQSDPEIEEAMERENSWVVVDPEGRHHYRFAALAALCRTNALLWPLRFFLEHPPLSAWGTRAYRAVAADRNRAGAALGFLTFRPLHVRTSPLVEATAAAFLIYVTLWNVRTLDFGRNQAFFPVRANWVADLTRVDQYWDMFAPFPLRTGGWYVIPGKLKDGTEVDLLRDGAAVSWERPARIDALFPSDRWRKYMVNLAYPEFTDQLLYYGSYLCRKWNRDHTVPRQVDTFRIYYLATPTLPGRRYGPTERRMLWEHYCDRPCSGTPCR